MNQQAILGAPVLGAPSTPKVDHVSVAENLAIELAERFNEEQCNEIIRIVRASFSEKRLQEIECLENRIALLKATLEVL